MSRFTRLALAVVALIVLAFTARFVMDQRKLAVKVADEKRRELLRVALERLPLAKDVEWTMPAGLLPVCLYIVDSGNNIMRLTLDGRKQELVMASPGKKLFMGASGSGGVLAERNHVTVSGVPNGVYGMTTIDESEGRFKVMPPPGLRWDKAWPLPSEDTGGLSQWALTYRAINQDDTNPSLYRHKTSAEFSCRTAPTFIYQFASIDSETGLLCVTSSGLTIVRDGDYLVLIDLTTGKMAITAKCTSAVVWRRDMNKPERFTPVCKMAKLVMNPDGSGSDEWFVWKMKDSTDTVLKPEYKPNPRRKPRGFPGSRTLTMEQVRAMEGAR